MSELAAKYPSLTASIFGSAKLPEYYENLRSAYEINSRYWNERENWWREQADKLIEERDEARRRIELASEAWLDGTRLEADGSLAYTDRDDTLDEIWGHIGSVEAEQKRYPRGGDDV